MTSEPRVAASHAYNRGVTDGRLDAEKQARELLDIHQIRYWDSRVYNQGQCACGILLDTSTTDYQDHIREVFRLPELEYSGEVEEEDL